MGLSVVQQIQKLEVAFTRLSEEGEGGISGLSREDGARQSRGEANESARALESRISEGFDRLNQNVGAAFSAYSGALKLAVAAIDRSEPGADHSSSPPVEIPPRMMGKATG